MAGNRAAALSIGVAWNGVGDPAACFDAGERANFVEEVLVSPMDQATAELAMAASRQHRKVRVLAAGDTGIYSAWNKLVAACRTSHIAFHGIDDLLLPECGVGIALASLEANDMLVSSIRFATPKGAETAIYHHRESCPPALSLGRHAGPACPEVCWPVTVIRGVGGLDERFRIAGDADLYFRVRPRVRRVDCEAVMLTMLDGGASVSAHHARTVWLENRRIATANGQTVPLGNRLLSGLFLNGRYLLWRLGGAEFADRATDAARALAGKPSRYALVHQR